MKIEKGKFYRARNGAKVEVLTTDNPSTTTPVVMLVQSHGNMNGGVIFARINGRIWHENNQHPYDLIAEWRDEPKAGEVWKTRDGRTARIVCDDRSHPRYPVVAVVSQGEGRVEDIFSYRADGSFDLDDDGGHLDLVERVS